MQPIIRKMKRKFIVWLVLLCCPWCLLAQQEASYNQKGDEAMKRQDYREAKMWYEEGVSQCDAYSINQVTTIWLKNTKMRPSMRSLMNKCLNCLNVQATENDTTAMKQLIVYYTEGIGSPVSEELADYWKDRLEKSRQPVVPFEEYVRRMELESASEPMEFFIGYLYSTEMPYGITFGGVKKRFGWYARFKTNMSFNGHTAECNNGNGGQLLGNASASTYHFTDNRKVNAYAATVGFMVKCTSWLYASIGLGYGSRNVLYEYVTTDLNSGQESGSAWAKNVDASNSGVAGDVDLMLRFGPIFVSGGCSTVNFKYVDLNASVGVFF